MMEKGSSFSPWQGLVALPVPLAIMFGYLGAYVDSAWFWGFILPAVLGLLVLFGQPMRTYFKRYLEARRLNCRAKLFFPDFIELAKGFKDYFDRSEKDLATKLRTVANLTRFSGRVHVPDNSPFNNAWRALFYVVEETESKRLSMKRLNRLLSLSHLMLVLYEKLYVAYPLDELLKATESKGPETSGFLDERTRDDLNTRIKKWNELKEDYLDLVRNKMRNWNLGAELSSETPQAY